MIFSVPTSRVEAEALDRIDPLRAARHRFVLPEGVIYLDGHSLGPPTRAALEGVERAAKEEWAKGLIRSWNDAGWIDLPKTVGARLAQLVGAEADEVHVCDSVSVNLFKLAIAALPLALRRTVLIEEDEFPTDQYIARGVTDLIGARLVRGKSGEGATLLALEGGVLIKSVVNYRTGRVADMEEHEAVARVSGGLVIWDLSHATGVLDISLARCGAKLAAGCTYKFLNGGPGAPAFVYVRKDMSPVMRSPIAGWMGHEAPFAFDAGYEPREHAARFATGTPAILSLSALAGALDAFDGIDIGAAAAKARALGDLCLARTKEMGLSSISPDWGGERGGHVSLTHSDGYAIVQALAARQVIADFRAPDAIRFGFSPLFVRFVDVWDAMEKLREILATRGWDAPEFRRRAFVT